jgi:SRSO17 transposase
MATARKNLWPTPMPQKPVKGRQQDFLAWKREQRTALDAFKKKCGG